MPKGRKVSFLSVSDVPGTWETLSDKWNGGDKETKFNHFIILVFKKISEMNKPKEMKSSIPKSQLTQIQMSRTQVYKMHGMVHI